MKIHLTFDGRVVAATLSDTEAARAFVALLPLTVTLHDLFSREKFGLLPHAIGPAEARSQAYAVGDLICWAAGPHLAVLYADDGAPLCGGFHRLGCLDAGSEAFAAPGPLDVTIERPGASRSPCSANAAASAADPIARVL